LPNGLRAKLCVELSRLTLLVRFRPRQRQKPMYELLAASPDRAEVNPIGSLIDADMGAYYNLVEPAAAAGSRAVVIAGLV
jgi:hypothetical protein